MATFGGPSNLIANTMTLILPPEAKYWFLECRDVAFLDVQFVGLRAGACSPIGLNPALVPGGVGDWLDSFRFPFLPTSVILTSTIATARFASGWSPTPPELSQMMATAGYLNQARIG